jgi:hypothetical protein
MASPPLVELLAGTSVVAFVAAPNPGGINGHGSWEDVTLTYTAVAADVGKFLGIGLVSNLNNNQVNWDDVTLDATAAPEPMTMVLGGTGLLALAYAGRRRLFGRQSEANQRVDLTG